MLGRGYMSYSENVLFPINFFSQLPRDRQTEYKEILTKEGSTKIVYFMTPGTGIIVLGRDYISLIVKIYYFFYNILLNSWT